MAPKRREMVVLSSTKKTVRETVQVTVVHKPEGDSGDQVQEPLETVPVEDKVEEEERVTTEISLEGLSNVDKARKQPQTVQIPVEAPDKDKVQTQQQTEQVTAKEPTNETSKSMEVENVKRKRSRKRKDMDGNEGYKTYVFRVLKQVHPGLAISSQAMSVINSLMKDMFEKIADEATKLSKYSERKTLSSREIQGAVRLVLPGELGKHAVAEGSKAVTNYASYNGKGSKLG
ncbi:hypothetical protein PTKIN_Ptkin11bG0049600 [Pterospermum kingtungense]